MTFLPKIQRAAYIMAKIAGNSGEPLSLYEIAGTISLSYIEQITRQLRLAGLVQSSRGPGGGYKLARRADQITLGQIADAVTDGKEWPSCGSELLDGLFVEAHGSALAYLDTVPLSEVTQINMGVL